MSKFLLLNWPVCLLLLLRNPIFSESSYDVEIRGLEQCKNVTVYCCSKNEAFFPSINSTLRLKCEKDFVNSRCFMEIKTPTKLPVETLEITSKHKQLNISFIKDIAHLKFRYTEVTEGEPWKLTVDTATNSIDLLARVYFLMNCESKQIMSIPLANSLDNFKPGKTDIFDFMAPHFVNDNYCVGMFSTLNRKWILTSFTLTDANNVNYTFYHGEVTYYHRYFGYRGNDTVNWTIEVTTGSAGAINVFIELHGSRCSTKLTLDSKYDDFKPNSTDVFNVKAKKCSELNNITIGSSEMPAKWVLVKVNATQEDNGLSYVFYHNETLSYKQTFFVNQSTGDKKWLVTVCSNTSTDGEVYLDLFCRYGQAKKLRLSTAEDDFQAGRCGNFTLYLKYIGKLWMIKLSKPKEFQMNLLTLHNDGYTYNFYPPKNSGKKLELLSYETGIRIFTPDIKAAGQKVNECAKLCAYNITCPSFNVFNNSCYFDHSSFKPSTKYTFNPVITVWMLYARFPIQIRQINVTLVDSSGRLIIYTFPNREDTISSSFSTFSNFFSYLQKVTFETTPARTSCSNLKTQLNSTTAAQLTVFYLKPDKDCSYIINLKASKIYPRVQKTDNNPRESTIKTDTTLMTLPPTSSSSITHPTVEDILTSSDISTSSGILTSEPSSSISLTNHPIVTDLPKVTKNKNMCPCACPKNFSKQEIAQILKMITKELTLNKTETSSYLRSKTSAPDERVSSKVIGSTVVILMVVPFGLIVLLDLLPLFCLVYKKVASFL